jgi:adenine deaminase
MRALPDTHGAPMNQLRIAASLLIGAAAMGLVPNTHAQTAPTPAAAPRPIVLKANHLFDSVSGQMLDHGVIVVVGKTIQAVGTDLKVPEGAQVIELGDATLLPGFIDAHVH